MMSKYILLMILTVLFLGVGAMLVIFKYPFTKDVTLVSPGRKETAEQATKTPSSPPGQVTPSYNPPKEIHYNSATDLKRELETINPEILESDFEF